MNYLIKLIFISTTTTLIFTTGCSEHRANNAFESRERIESIKKNRISSLVEVEEYVSRIKNRILLVSDYPDAVINIQINQAPGEYFYARNHSKIEASVSFLQKLRNEAELAALLSNAIAIMQNNLTTNINLEETTSQKIDNLALNYMYRAGYDPISLVELQERYHNESMHIYNHYLQSVYSINPPSAHRLINNRMLANSFPRGLLRGSDRYQEHLGL